MNHRQGRHSVQIGLVVILLAAIGCSGARPKSETTERASVDSSAVLDDLSGASHSVLSNDQPTVLVFWATWCAPCRAELPELAKAHGDFGRGARFLGVLSGPDRLVDATLARRLVAQAGVGYPQLRDRTGEIAKSFDVDGTPTIVVVGPDGTIRFHGHHLPSDFGGLLR